ncbi:uncharacterized protein LACBIDRAFT_292343 [Laccaria bicolor S238N-H82]|uniref:Predicted protein n=1 Tax=Laccaria bicolor (strain S238N-H82 / ATCC MYA-4686) TaxID=486041 RepID=B0CSV5_LACBS|nr:uncharacterized protein LACBIDRAFT_292343 [Laccaria bicolor S238N-H82]EDR14376.1 predicted protein [Laccaria bicolor S238N-H82]|eukprot:XP_001874935.1 predicted protein [Laccaria bicolor S238N-H82]
MLTMKTEDSNLPHVVIVGAGLGGIATAVKLKRQLGFNNFTPPTTSSDLPLRFMRKQMQSGVPGETIRILYAYSAILLGTLTPIDAQGCGSDVPGHWYSLSTDLNPRWPTLYASQPELCAYWEELWHRHDLVRHTHLNTAVTNAEWDTNAQQYRITLRNTITGKVSTVEAEVMFYAIGGFQGPIYPKDIGGLDSFRGDLFHSAQWRHDVALKGKRVGVIGNGCSAAQFIPEISADSSVKIVNFVRTPQWYITRGNYRYPRFVQMIFAYVPFIVRWYRNCLMARALTAYIKKMAPKDQLRNLIPSYAPGCKRIIVDPGYLKSLHRPNVSLNWDGIETVVPEGIRMKTGETVPLDVIIFGTGYSTEPASLKVRGSTGGTIHEYFASQGGPKAYVGTCMPGFPNLFTLLGPNVATGHASVIFSQEAQLIKPILDGQAKSFEISSEATDEYNTWLQDRLSTSVWTDCTSYYQGAGGKVISTFPGPVALFWWLTRSPRWELFRGVWGKEWEEQLRRNKSKKWAWKWGFITVLASLVLSMVLQKY